jgi:hypothetical protein
MSARDTLHLATIEAWQAIASSRPAPRLDLLALYQAICEVFETNGRQNPFDQFDSTWEDIARQHASTITDEHGDLLPDLDDAITSLITAAIWFGITTGYFTIAGGRCHIPRKFLAA